MNAKEWTFQYLDSLEIGGRFTGYALMQMCSAAIDVLHYPATYLRYVREYRDHTGRDIVCISKPKSLYEVNWWHWKIDLFLDFISLPWYCFLPDICYYILSHKRGEGMKKLFSKIIETLTECFAIIFIFFFILMISIVLLSGNIRIDKHGEMC